MKTKHTPETITALLAVNDFAIERALIRLYERQTATEQSAGMTVEHNGQGFSSCDAEIFSSFASQILANKYGNPNGKRLSPKQLAYCRKQSKSGKMKIARYARQLAEIANAVAIAA